MSDCLSIRQFEAADLKQWLNLRCCLWPDLADDPEAEQQGKAWLDRADATVIVLADREALRGFIEVGERTYADGCDTSPVAFLEGWFVLEGLRHQGWGRALVRAAADWAHSRGLSEFASDALLENEAAQRAHRAIGFEEVERAVHYRIALVPQAIHGAQTPVLSSISE